MASFPICKLYRKVAQAPTLWPVLPTLPSTYALMKSADISTKPKARFFELALEPLILDCIRPPKPKLSNWPIAAPLNTETSSGLTFS